jgi:hypothetical protein
VELRAQREALQDGAGDLWPPEVRNVNPDNLGVIADAQSTYSRHTAAAIEPCWNPSTPTAMMGSPHGLAS